MIISNGKRVFAQVDNDLICYNFDEKNKTWNEYGAHYSTSSIKDGKVVISNENDTVDIGFTNNSSGSRVIAHEMGSQNISFYEINLKTLVWNKRQTITNVEQNGSSNGSYVMNFDGDIFILYTSDSNNDGNIRYYSYNSSTKQYDLKFTISGASGITNDSSIRNVTMNKDGSRFIISDTNGNNGSLGGDGNGVVKIYDVSLTDFSYSVSQTITATSSDMFGASIDMNHAGTRFIVSESISEKYHVYEYDNVSTTWSSDISLNTYDENILRYNNSLSMSGLGDVVFIGETDPDGTEEGIVFGYFLDASSNWTKFNEISGNFLTTIDGSNETQTDISFGLDDEFGKTVKVNALGTHLMIQSKSYNDIDERSFIVLKLVVGLGVSPPTLSEIVDSVDDLANLDMDASEIANSGFTNEQMKNAGVSADTLITGGVSQADLLNSGFGLTDITEASDDLSSLFDSSANVNTTSILTSVPLETLLSKNVSVSDVLSGVGDAFTDSSTNDINLSEFKNAGISATDLKGAGVPAKNLKDSAFTPTNLVDAGFSVSELKDAEISAGDLKGAGLGITDLVDNFEPEDLVNADFDDTAFESAGFTVVENKTISKTIGGIEIRQEVKPIYKNDDIDDLSTEMPDVDDLEKIMNSNPDVGAVLTVKATDSNGGNISDLSDSPIVLTLDLPNLDPTKENLLYKFDDSFNILDPQPEGYPVTLTYNSVTGKYTATMTSLSTVGGSAIRSRGKQAMIYFAHESLESDAYTNQKFHTFMVFYSGLYYGTRLPNGYFNNFADLNPYPKYEYTKGRGRRRRTITANRYPNTSWDVTNAASFSKSWPYRITWGNLPNSLTGSKWWTRDLNKKYLQSKGQRGWHYNSVGGLLNTIEIDQEGEFTITSIPSTFYIYGNSTTPIGGRAITFKLNYDITPPVATITSTDVSTNDYTNKTPLTFNFELSEIVTNFTLNKISTTNCGISNFTQISDLSYSFSIIPTKEGVCNINLPVNSITDRAGNFNDVSHNFTFNYDITPPTFVLSSSTINSGDKTNDSFIVLNITPSELLKDFTKDIIQIENGATLGSLLNENGIYTISVKPSVNTSTTVKIHIAENTIQDLAGNFNDTASNTFIWYYDKIPPVATILSSTITHDSFSKDQYIDVSFTISENVENFDASSVSITNGYLSDFSGSGTIYSGKVYPDVSNAYANILIDIPADVYTDPAGNNNSVSEQFKWKYDPISPIIEIITSISSGITTGDPYIEFDLSSNKNITNVSDAIFTVTNGNVGDITGADNFYSGKLFPSGTDQTSIYVNANTVTDIAGNTNDTSSNEFLWTFDGTSPIISLSTSDLNSQYKTTNNNISVTAEITDNNVTLQASNFTVTGGSISNFTNTTSGTYTFTFTSTTPNVVNTCFVDSNEVSDDVGNTNPKSNIVSWTFVRAAPTMTISHTSYTTGVENNDNSIELSFTASESVSNFIKDDIIVTNGSVSYFSGTGASYVSNIVPNNLDQQSQITISVPSNKFEDSYGLVNDVDVTPFIWNFDPIKPTVVITANVENGANNNNASITLTFTFSKNISTFTVSNLSVTNATVSNISGSGTIYTATLSPNTSSASDKVTTKVIIPIDNITDSAGNKNEEASNEFIWTYDGTAPTMTIYSSDINSGDIANRESINLVFSSSKDITNFTDSDIIVTNGTIDTFTGTGSTYFATLIADTDYIDKTAEISVYVDVNSFLDSANNLNTTKSNTFVWNYDDEPVLITMTERNNISTNSTTNDDFLIFDVSCSKTIDYYDSDKLIIQNANTFNFEISGGIVSFKVSPNQSGLQTSLHLLPGFIVTTLGKRSTTQTDTFYWTYDGEAPIIRFSSTTQGVINGSVTSIQDISMAIEISEVPLSFGQSDVAVTNGTISNFTGSGTDYTFDFNITNQGEARIYIPEDNTITDAANNVSVPYNDFIFTYDSTKPTVSISHASLSSGLTSNDSYIDLSINVSKKTNINTDSIIVTNGTKSNFTEGDNYQYSIRIFPNVGTNNTTITVSIPSENISDDGGLKNEDGAIFVWNYNNLIPTMTISSTISDGSIVNDASLVFTFLASENITNFTTSSISLTNASLSNFDGSGSVYTAKVTPSSNGLVTLFIDNGKFQNIAGNENNNYFEFDFTSDQEDITAEITGSISSGLSSDDAFITITITTNKSVTLGEIINALDGNVTNGSLTNISGSGKSYTATLLPNVANSQSSIVIPENTLTDVAGNTNTSASNTYTWTYNGSSPTITLSTTNTFVDGTKSNTATISVSAVLSGDGVMTLEETDISFTNGTVSNFVEDSSNNYSFDFTSTTEGSETTIFVPENSFTDTYSSGNIASNIIKYSFDTTLPSMTITSDDIISGNNSNKSFITLTFTAIEDISGFNVDDIDLSNATISSLTSNSASVYNAILTPSVNEGQITVSVGANKYSDIVGNLNNTASNTFIWNYDKVAPTITISSNDQNSGTTSNVSSIELIFTLSEEVQSFSLDNIDVTNGSLSNLSGSGTSYTATLQPISASTISVTVPSSSVQDVTGNFNTEASNTYTWTFDSDNPIISITGDTISNGSKTTERQITVFLSVSDNTATLNSNNITLLNSTIISFAQTKSNPLTYTAILQATNEGNASSIKVASNEITDSGGNGNIESVEFEWMYDITLPVITISSDDMNSGESNSLSNIKLKFTALEDLNDFTITDINRTNCTISEFTQISTKEYHAKVIPTNDGTIVIYIDQGSITDDAGNENPLTSSFTWNYDGTQPIILLSSTRIVSGQYYDENFIAMTATVTNETNLSLSINDFSLINGSINTFTAVSNSEYTFNFRSNGSGLISSIQIPENTIFDDASNGNIGTDVFTWSYDAEPLTYSITSDDITNNGYIKTNPINVTVTFSEEVANFRIRKIELTNCTIDAFTGSGKTYNITLNATENSKATMDIPSTTIVTMNAITKSISDSSFNWNYDTTSPTFTIFSLDQASGVTNNNSSLDLTIQSSENVNNFTVDDIVLTGKADLSLFDGSGSNYSVRVTPSGSSTIGVSINANTVSDLAGNLNQERSSYIWYYDNTPPEITINSGGAHGTTITEMPIDISFSISENIQSFTTSNITTTNCAISDFSGSDTLYTAKIVPSSNGTVKVVVLDNELQDTAGNYNDSSSNELSFTFSSSDILANLFSVDVSNGDNTKDQSVSMVLQLSEEISQFSTPSSSNFEIVNGSIGTITKDTNDATKHTFEFTSSQQLVKSSIKLKEGELSGDSLNDNLESNTFEWIYDATPPSITITSTTINSGETSNDENINITFTSSEDISGFDISSVTVTNAAISNFNGSGNSYNAVITPTVTSDTITISVGIGKFSDLVGNLNTAASNTFSWIYDGEIPTMSITSDDITNNGETDSSFVSFTFTSNKNLSNMTSDKITIKNGSIHTFTEVSKKIYTVVIISTDRTIDKNISLQLDSDKVSDDVGNRNNTTSNIFSFIIKRIISKIKEPDEVASIIEDDLGVNFGDLGITDTTTFTEELETVFTQTVTANETMSVPKNVTGMTNSRIFNLVIDQMISRNNVRKVKIPKQDIPFNNTAEEKLGTREDIQVAPSNISIDFTDYVPETSKSDSALYCPIGNVDDYIEINIENVSYRITKTSSDEFSLSRNGNTPQTGIGEGETRTFSGYVFVFGSLTIVNDNTDDDDDTDTSGNTYSAWVQNPNGYLIPCFREGTNILTLYGYKKVEELIPEHDILIDDTGKQLELLNVEKYIKPYDGVNFPHVVPCGSKLSDEFICNEDLHITHNHCIFVPQRNQFIPPSRMNMPQDQRPVDKYTFYHVFTQNYFTDVVIANGIPCETYSPPIMNKIMTYENGFLLLERIMKACEYEVRDGSRYRMTRGQFKNIVKRHKKKNNRKITGK